VAAVGHSTLSGLDNDRADDDRGHDVDVLVLAVTLKTPNST
jgi:hypothetical protein